MDKKIRLQLAMDFCRTYENTKAILDEIGEYVDIIELGTPLLMENGHELIKKIKSDFPESCVLADLKIMDAGRYETEEALKAGADIVTIMAVTEDETIKAGVEVAHEYGKEIMTDLLSVHDVESRIPFLESIGVDYICLHTSKDLQQEGMDASENFRKYKEAIKTSKIALAGGINRDSVESYAKLMPEVMVVGEGLMNAPDRVKCAEEIVSILKEYSK